MHADWIAGLILCTSVISGGQGAPTDRPKPGKVSGLVIDTKSGEPVRKALVVLRIGEQTKGIGALTDASGKFLFEEIEPGNYIARVERDGYVMAKESLGQTVAVRAGEITADVKLNLLPTAVISGRVLDADGEPLAGASIQITSVHSNLSGPAPRGYAVTDDRGEYRAFHLAPGEYKLSATYKPDPHPLDLEVRMQPVAGGHPTAYPAVYYPGTLEVAQATAITVEPGSELRGMDLHLIPQRAVKVRGHVTGLTDTSPISFALVNLRPVGPAVGQSWDALARDGEFELTDVLPGTYRLDVTAGVANESTRLTGRGKLVVGSTDMEGVQLAVSPPRKLTGRIVLPENSKLPAGLMILLESQEPGDTQGGGLAMVGADGNFVLNEVPPGEYSAFLRSTAEAGDLYISSIQMGDMDALTHGVSVGKAPLASLEVSLKANGAALEIAVTDEKGKAIPAAKVLLAPDTPRERQVALYGECSTDVNGICRIVGIAPGAYHAFAFPSEPTLDHRDSNVMKPFEKYGKAVKFAEGDKPRIELSPPPV